VLTMAIPVGDGGEYVTETIGVEYEWTPPRCAQCCVFGHGNKDCPKQICVTKPSPNPNPKVNGDGFTEVKGRKTAKKNGIHVTIPKPRVEYRPLDYKKMVGARPSASTVKSSESSKIQIQNSFSVLNPENMNDGGTLKSNKDKGKLDRDEMEDMDEEDVEVIYEESTDLTRTKTGASSSSLMVSNG